MERVQDQLDRVMTRLGAEQAANSGLRDQMHAMRMQIDELRRENDEFRKTIAAHQQIAATLQADLHRAGNGSPASP